MKKRARFEPPAVCPVCGEDVPSAARACPECGADERSGWDEDAASGDGLDLPEDPGEFDYERFMRDEFGSGKPRISPVWWIGGILALLAIAFAAFNR
jgi:hypothetical protein